MTTLAASPGSLQMSSYETAVVGFDVTAPLAEVGGVAPSSPVARLVELVSGRSYAAGLSGAASVSGSNVLQTVTALEPGVRYRFTITYTAAPGVVLTSERVIECVF